jgi:hypothetical protein
MTMALQGRALKYNEIIPLHHGENKLFLPGPFDPTLRSGDGRISVQRS